MIYLAVFVAGAVSPYVAWWAYAMLHDFVYMPLIWEPRHRRWCRRFEEERVRPRTEPTPGK